LPAGPAQPVSTQFHWTPTVADVGLFHLNFTATDQLQQTSSCDVSIRVFGSPGIDLCQAGMGARRPCSNPPSVSPGGCDNSLGTGGARLTPSAERRSASTVVFTTTGRTRALSVVLQGNAFLQSGVIYGQALVRRRLAQALVRRTHREDRSPHEQSDLKVPARSAQLVTRSRPARPATMQCTTATSTWRCPPTSTFNVTHLDPLVPDMDGLVNSLLTGLE
jgi:hypothetical protein